MASYRSCLPAVVFLVATTMVAAASAASYTVGESIGWTIPSDTDVYTKWASSHTFQVNDKLVFNFETGLHNVMKVSAKEFKDCTAVSPIESYTSGPVTITLNSTGSQYFLCSVGQHCNFGQKVAINVVAATKPSTPPAKSPSSPPSASSPSAGPPAPGPSTGSNTTSPSGPSASVPSPTQQKSSASGLIGGLRSTALLVVAVCLALVR